MLCRWNDVQGRAHTMKGQLMTCLLLEATEWFLQLQIVTIYHGGKLTDSRGRPVASSRMCGS